jgi:hypothetical protein
MVLYCSQSTPMHAIVVGVSTAKPADGWDTQ